MHILLYISLICSYGAVRRWELSILLSSTLFSFTLFSSILLCELTLLLSGLSLLLTSFSLSETFLNASLLRIPCGTSFLSDVSSRKYSSINVKFSRLFNILIKRRWIPTDVNAPNISNTLLSKKEHLIHPEINSATNSGEQPHPAPSDTR